jgi:hypothetical protein
VRKNLMLACLLALPLMNARAQGSAIFAGTVVDFARRPLAGAEVSLPDAAITKLTDANGVFRLTDIPAGKQRVLVRRIGFGQLDTVMIFRENETIERRVTLGRIVTLDSVVVAAARGDLLMADFEENRKMGFGRFITPEQLTKMEGQTLASVLQQLQGIALTRGSGGQSWVLGRRGPTSRCPTPRAGENMAQARANQEKTDSCLRAERLFYVPEEYESKQGLSRQCYALVYLDRSLMNPGKPTIPFDVNTLTTMQLQAVEWYEGSGSVPAKYSANDARCGLLVLHTRRKG